MRVEEVRDRERALLLGQRVGSLQPDLEMRIARLVARKRLELHQHRGHEVEGQAHRGELPEQRDHPPVVLQRVQPHPRQDVLPCEQVLVERLMHVPQERNARHNGLDPLMSIIDRYVIRQVLMPFLLGLLVFTFIFIIPPLLEYAEELVAKGVSGPLVVGLIGLLVPQALAVTIPMSLLLALLVAFGRLSADREFVAMQACGISLRRLLWPVALISISAWAATSYVLIALVPGSNQKFLDTVFNVASQRAEGEVKARTFFTDFPNFVLYVRELSSRRQRMERRLPGRPSRRSRRGDLSGPARPRGHRPPTPADRPGVDQRNAVTASTTRASTTSGAF